MNNIQENKFSMYEGLLTFLKEYKTITDEVPAIAAVIQRLDEQIQEIRRKDIARNKVAAGKTMTKEQAKVRLIETIIPVAAALSVYALSKGDNSLREQMKLSKTGLDRLRDTELVSVASNCHKTALELMADLTAYGISEAHTSELKTRTDAYQNAQTGKESAVAKRVTARLTLTDLFRQADTLLKQEMDPLLKILAPKHPEFDAAYRNLRGVKAVGRRRKPNGESQATTPELSQKNDESVA